MTNEKLQNLIETFHTMRKLVTFDLFFAIYDETLTVRYLFPEDRFHNTAHVGERFNDTTGKFAKVLATGTTTHDLYPSENFGIMLEENLVPIIEDGHITGIMSTAYIPVNQRHLVAQEWALQSIYHLILSVNADSDRYTLILWNKNLGNKNFYNIIHHDTCYFNEFCNQCSEFIHPDDKEAFFYFTSYDFLKDALINTNTLQLECRFRENNSNYHWLELLITKVNRHLDEPEATTYLFMIRNIHKYKSAEINALLENEVLIRQLQQRNDALFDQSVRDELTGLYNRKGLIHFSKQLINDVKENDLCLYTFTTDLNGLKYINDNFGHAAGDQAICAITGILKESLPQSTVIARVGGDEFVALDTFETGSTRPDEIAKLFEKNIAKLNAANTLPFTISSSYGWDFRAAKDIKSLDSCMNSADRNMYQMKFQYHLSHQNLTENHVSTTAISSNNGNQVLLLCTNPDTIKAVTALFDSNSTITVVETYYEAEHMISQAKNTILFFIDNAMEDNYCLTVLKKLPLPSRQHCLSICLLENNDEIVPKIFAEGCSEALLKPYETELNRHHVNYLLHMNGLYAKFTHHTQSTYEQPEP